MIVAARPAVTSAALARARGASKSRLMRAHDHLDATRGEPQDVPADRVHHMTRGRRFTSLLAANLADALGEDDD